MQREKLSELEKRFNLQNKYHLEKTKRYRKQFETLHDIGNHLAVLEMKLTSQEDRAYIKSLREKLGSAVRETGYGNIDCIVLIKYIEMAKKGIELDVKGVLPESIPWLEAVDIMNIMGNSIDNAINAVSRIRRSERKPIKLSFSCSDDYLAIQMINQTAQRNIQPKRKGDSEGLGLKSIAASAEKYGGGMSAEDKDGLFTLSVILYSKNK